MKRKIHFISEVAEKEKCHAILQPGDLCDSFEFPDRFKTFWMKELKHVTKVITVVGQHDLRYHTAKVNNTAFGVLTGAIEALVLAEGEYNTIGRSGEQPVYIFGSGFNKKIPNIIDKLAFNILLTHRMVILEKLWAEQEEYDLVGPLLRKNEFNLIISGDNHTSFDFETRNKKLINCGSLMRSSIDQIDHKPCVYICDTEKNAYAKIMIPIEDSSVVFDLGKVDEEKEKNEKLKKLSESLKNKSRIKGLNYSDRVHKRVKELKRNNAITPMTERIIEEVMENE